jgi:hypothetical protein|tara:strand:- start:2045 stop:2632 length:588 start_codon:yes stop_codon:yes gene_type:complete
MGRRLGVKRLNALSKTGASVTGSLGTGASGSIGYRKIIKSGNEVTTELYVDLASSKGALYQAGITGTIIGHSSSAAGSQTAGKANITQINQKENGIVTLVEMTCVETPAGGDTDINLMHAATAQAFSGSTSLTSVLNAGTAVIGAEDAAAFNDNSLDARYLYLTFGGSTDSAAAAAYTAGKFLIRLYGHVAPDDV